MAAARCRRTTISATCSRVGAAGWMRRCGTIRGIASPRTGWPTFSGGAADRGEPPRYAGPGDVDVPLLLVELAQAPEPRLRDAMVSPSCWPTPTTRPTRGMPSSCSAGDSHLDGYAVAAAGGGGAAAHAPGAVGRRARRLPPASRGRSAPRPTGCPARRRTGGGPCSRRWIGRCAAARWPWTTRAAGRPWPATRCGWPSVPARTTIWWTAACCPAIGCPRRPRGVRRCTIRSPRAAARIAGATRARVPGSGFRLPRRRRGPALPGAQGVHQ